MLQRVLPCGGRVASVMTRATFAFEIDGLRPRPGLWSRAARPDVSKRTDHSETRLGVVFRRSATTSTPTPASRSRMMLARSLSRAPMVLDPKFFHDIRLSVQSLDWPRHPSNPPCKSHRKRILVDICDP